MRRKVLTTASLMSESLHLTTHNCTDLVQLFERCFRDEFNTCLIPGGEEPEYVPAETPAGHWTSAGGSTARIVFTRDYFASALHEIAHWCVAGRERRRLHDYGYWYAPDGRTAPQQAEFERVEVKPQAMEWLFSQACGFRFRVSADNLTSNLGPSESFKRAVVQQARLYLVKGLPGRAQTFCDALVARYGGKLALEHFVLERLN